METEIQNRLSPLTTEAVDEVLDPRIQGELEKLNKASDDINKLELELDDERASFRQALSDTTHKLNALAKKLGNCVEKARPYYDQRHKVLEAHSETQKVAIRFERACSMHEAAKEMVQLAEQGYMGGEASTDPAWQEMLNHATMKVNEAERERNESEVEHMKAMLNFQKTDNKCQHLQKDLKRMITKSRPYFELKAAVNQQMEDNKRVIKCLEEEVQAAKQRYAEALRSLEKISDSIHQQRMLKREEMELGVREAGVGSETPSPPPVRPKDSAAMDGQNVVVTHEEESPPRQLYSDSNENQGDTNRASLRLSTDISANANSSGYAESASTSRLSYNNTSKKDLEPVAHRRQSVAETIRQSVTSSRPKMKAGLILNVNMIMDPLAQTYQAESIQPTRKHDRKRREKPKIQETKTPSLLSPDSAMFPESSIHSSLKTSLSSNLDDDRSETESIASTGTMLDDDQVEYLTIEFSDMFNSSEDLSKQDESPHQVTLPPKLSYLEKYVPNASSNNTPSQEGE